MASSHIPEESYPPPASILSKGGKNAKNWGTKTIEAVRFSQYITDSQTQRKSLKFLYLMLGSETRINRIIMK